MKKQKFAIKFKDGHYLMDPITEEPKLFDSNFEAKRYGDLSFGNLPSPAGIRGREWKPHHVVRYGDDS